MPRLSVSVVILLPLRHCRLPSSVCCRASSATASPTLLRTELSVSLVRQPSSFARMASRSASLSVRKRSAVWPEADFRGFDDWRLKMTAANVRVYSRVSFLLQALACYIRSLPRYLVRVQSARRGPSRAHRASGRPIPRSTAARPSSAAHCPAIGGPAEEPRAPCGPRREGRTYSRFAGGGRGERPR
jgi:hypothetical protein